MGYPPPVQFLLHKWLLVLEFPNSRWPTDCQLVMRWQDKLGYLVTNSFDFFLLGVQLQCKNTHSQSKIIFKVLTTTSGVSLGHV